VAQAKLILFITDRLTSVSPGTPALLFMAGHLFLLAMIDARHFYHVIQKKLGGHGAMNAVSHENQQVRQQ